MQDMAQYSLPAAPAYENRSWQAPGKLDNAMIEQRHADLKRHSHACKIVLGENVVSPNASEALGHETDVIVFGLGIPAGRCDGQGFVESAGGRALRNQPASPTMASSDSSSYRIE